MRCDLAIRIDGKAPLHPATLTRAKGARAVPSLLRCKTLRDLRPVNALKKCINRIGAERMRAAWPIPYGSERCGADVALIPDAGGRSVVGWRQSIRRPEP